MIQDSQILDAVKYIMKDILNFQGSTVDKPSEIIGAEAGHKKVYSGNLCLNIFDGSAKGLLNQCHAYASKSKQLGSNNDPNEHFVTDGVCSFDGAMIGWYLTARN